ncbi:MAG: GNAT family N-acetyltransferase, partial [Candidatus Heimdallarchaeota archaeon]|nr:GNAT family N-acetyltransferase [Candidatus Heimdallarchaeota archaeon]
MDYTLDDIFRLRKTHLNSAAELFSRVFLEDSIAMWMFPEKETREQNLYHYHRFRINYGLLYGEVYATSPYLEGLAVWIYSENVEMTYWKMIRAGGLNLLRNVGKDAVKRMLIIGNYVSQLHRKHATFPHLFLSPIGVDPELQGKGNASKLLRPIFNRLDQEHLHCFLETQSRTNVDIYLHYGFEVINKTTIPDTE